MYISRNELPSHFPNCLKIAKTADSRRSCLSHRTREPMITTPVVALLLFDAFLLLGVSFFFDRAHQRKDAVFLALLFFCSGMPALVYQIVWQRALFAIYGVNAQSVAVVVTAFMLGLGLGSLVGGRLSVRFPR